MTDVISLASTVAPALIAIYKSKGLDSQLMPDTDSVIKGLQQLIKEKYLSESDLTQAVDLLAQGVGTWSSRLEAGIKKIQEDGSILADGVLGNKTIHWLTAVSRCYGLLKKDRTDIGRAAPGVTFEEGLFVYFIESLPDVAPDSEGHDRFKLLEAAFDFWKETIKIQVRRTSKLSQANIIVRRVSIDGPSSILADAHVGPPDGDEQLELRFDVSETWEAAKFLSTACHEIGHLIGLSHSRNADDLMAPRLSSAKRPTAGDRDAALALGYVLAPPPPKKLPRNTDV